MASYIIYKLSDAKKKFLPIQNYDAQRKDIYQELRQQKTVKDFFDQDSFKKIDGLSDKIFQDLIKDIETVSPKMENRSRIFNGPDDISKIKELINQLTALKNAENLKEFDKILSNLKEADNFITKELKPKLNGNSIFGISTKEYQYLLEAAEIAKNTNDINYAKKKASDYYGALLGDLGESLGLLYGYNIISSELKQELLKQGIHIEVTNVGDIKIDNKRAIGDTEIRFVYENGQILGSISMSNKLSGKFAKGSKSFTPKLRQTTVNQLPEGVKPLYYNLISFHCKGTEHQLELATNKETLSFRRYVASLILNEKLFGAFEGDNVYFLNYGNYMFTMNNLIDYWLQNKGIPYTSINNSVRKTLLLAEGQGMSIEEAEKKISSIEIMIYSSLHLGNLVGIAQGNNENT